MIPELVERGFSGFLTVRELRDSLHLVPGRPGEPGAAGGVYVVVRDIVEAPHFLERSPAGWFKNQDPTESIATLKANWVDGAQVLYIGKAGIGATLENELLDEFAARYGRDPFANRRRTGGNTPRPLRDRVRELIRFAYGARVGHRGGEWLWQLEGWEDLRVAWLTVA
jgi:hypothetical protein